MRSGLVAEFDAPEAIERAYGRLTALGYTRLRSWTPYAVRGIVERLPASKVPWIMFGAGIGGAALAYLVQWWCNAYDYPINVGARPLNAVPAFIPISFESGVLASAISGFLSVLFFSGLPRLHHPMFEVDGFERTSVDRFWLGVDATDPRFDEQARGDLEAELGRLGALLCRRVGEEL